MNFISEIVDTNWDGSALDRQGRPYPKHYVWVKRPDKATPANPDPMLPHPIPVFINNFAAEGHTSSHPLKKGQRVLVTEIAHNALNRSGYAVIGFDAQADPVREDLRQTSFYEEYEDGSLERRVVAAVDPVEGKNDDWGSDNLNGEGHGLATRQQPDQRTLTITGPNGEIKNVGLPSDSTWEITDVAGNSVKMTALPTPSVEIKTGACKVKMDGAGQTVEVFGPTKLDLKSAQVGLGLAPGPGVAYQGSLVATPMGPGAVVLGSTTVRTTP